MVNQTFRKIEDIGTSEIYGKEYRKYYPKNNKKSQKAHKKKSSYFINKLIIFLIVLVVSIIYFGFKNNINFSILPIYFKCSLLKDKFGKIKNFIKYLFDKQNVQKLNL
jgi:hypothetical protein